MQTQRILKYIKIRMQYIVRNTTQVVQASVNIYGAPFIFMGYQNQNNDKGYISN